MSVIQELIARSNRLGSDPRNTNYAGGNARHAIRDAVRITGRPVRTVHLVGGGVANPLFCQLVASACALSVVAGPTEAASWGNVLVQARALGAANGSLPELRSLVRQGSA